MDPATLAALGIQATPLIMGLLGIGGSDETSPQLSPEIKQQLLMALLGQGRMNALVDPAASSLYGFSQAPPDAVPLRSAANQLAFALLPNFVRPGNSLFPGTAPNTVPFNAAPSAPFLQGQEGSTDPGGSGEGGTLTAEDISRRLRLQQLLAPEIESGKIQVLPNGRFQLTGFDDERGTVTTPDDIRNRLTPQSRG